MSHLPNDWAGLAGSHLWQVTALVVVVALITRFACRRQPHLAYLLWLLVVVKCLTPPVWSSPMGVFSWAQLQVVERTAETGGDRSGPSSAVSGTTPAVPNRAEYGTLLTEAGGPASTSVSPAASADARTAILSRPRGWALVGAVWLVGAIGLGGVLAAQWLRFRRLLCRSAGVASDAVQRRTAELAQRLGVRRRVAVLVTSEPLGPAVFGLARPTILMPQALLDGKTPEELDPVLAHELLHVRRGDVLGGALQMLAEVLWWFHPLVWWANREAGRERERCCDEEVLAGLKCRPAVYARCLLDVLAAERSARAALPGLGVHSVRVTSRRVEDIMKRRGRFHHRTPRWCWAVLFAAAAMVLPGRELILGGPSAGAPGEGSAAGPPGEEGPDTAIGGQVVDAKGDPVPQAEVAVLATSRRPRRGSDLGGWDPTALAAVSTNAQGRFHIQVPPFSSATLFSASLVAAKPDHAVGWQPLALEAEQHEVVIRLPEEQALRGRVVDSQGQPAAGARVYLRWLARQCLATGSDEGVGPREPRERFPAWPGPVTADEQGRFAIRGVSRHYAVSLRVVDDRFATWDFYVQPLGEKPPVRDAEYEERTRYLAKASDDVYADDASEELTLTPPPAQPIEGQVVYKDTGEPAGNARLTAYARQLEFGSAVGIAGQADAEGRFRLNPYPGKFFDVTAYPANGQPYLILEKTVKWPENAVRQKLEIALPRGVLVRGRITEGPSGKAVEGASVQYYAASKNPHLAEDVVTRWQGMVVSGAEGNFQIAVPAGKGTLLVHGPTADYAQRVIGSNEIYYGRPGGRRNYVHASIPLDLDANAEGPEVSASLQRGVTVEGRLVGPSGEAVDEAIMLTQLYISALSIRYDARAVEIRQGRFELPGCHPEKGTPVFFLDPENQWGAVVEVSGKMAGEQPLEVRLAPCGRAEARFVNTAGKPVVGHRPGLEIVMTPGVKPFPDPPDRESGQLWADQDFVANFDRLNYWDKPRTDEGGRCALPALIPDATYQLATFDKASSNWVTKDFRVSSGETLPLPEIVLKRED